MDTIVLIGYMGAGKSSVAAALGRKLHLKVHDTDACIEARSGMTISNMFRDCGEAYFRDQETSLLKELKEEGFEGILSTGGGMPLREENRELLRSVGKVFYLKASPASIAKRLSGDTTRPLLAGAKDMAEKERRIADMLSARAAAYEAAADEIIDTDTKNISKCVEEILQKLTK
ncbi:MAG: shikimate kinase [Lachnospiraceae bacterium]|nr:shikimate kinase [Lachnospiraceae bacterium]